jgi:hypothetical protein
MFTELTINLSRRDIMSITPGFSRGDSGFQSLLAPTGRDCTGVVTPRWGFDLVGETAPG